MRSFFFIFVSTLLNMFGTFAQVQIPDLHSRQELIRMADEFSRIHLEKKKKAILWAQENDVPVRLELTDGRVIELQYLDEKMLPVYYETRNKGAAFTTGADQLNPGGSLRLFTTGTGMTAGVWDGGQVSNTHPELISRVIIKDTGGHSNHATHVGGTIAASGVNSFAQGMAPDAYIHSYDWNNDASEMAAAAANGLLISNHSYGIALGWGWTGGEWRWYAHPDSTYDYRFGYYSNKSKTLDEIAFNAPHYLIVWAAGNDRTDTGDGSRPPDGPYNTVGPEGVSKNVLAVGAVRKLTEPYQNPWDVVMSNFSSWGPVNDGRIKPDIVGAGVNLFSPIAVENSYIIYSGTSMATPNVTGSLLLLQQLYSEINYGNYMKSATLKGLAIHTAREAGGSAGPDYQFGWGLLDTEKAARMILFEDGTDFVIQELTLSQDQVFEFPFTSNGADEIVATISWTDPAANPVSPSQSKTIIMLVNDLDLRIFNEAGDVEYFPWRLNPLTPASAASKGDNFRDNVERVNIPNPPAGNYVLRVTHKGDLLDGSQDFSLILQTRAVPERVTLYWVGNEGAWNDPQNWSFSSGGPAASLIPTIHDHVVFDNNSFSGPMDDEVSIILNDDAECYSFNWFPAKRVSFLSNGNSLSIFTSLFAKEENQLVFSSTDIIFTGDQSNNVVSFHGNGLAASTLVFEGPGNWQIKGDLQVGSVLLVNGNLVAKKLNLIVREIKADPSFAGTFDITNSHLDSLHILDFALADANLPATNSTLIFTDPVSGSDPGLLATGGSDLWNLKNHSNHLIINGDNQFRIFTGRGTTEFNGSNTYNSFYVMPGSEIVLKENTAQLITNQLDIQGKADSIVTIRSHGSENAVIEVLKRSKLCFDFLDIKKITVTGAAVFNAGTNSVIDNESIGWLTQNCDDILFANFDYEFACTNSFTYLYDRSTGNIDSWFWEIYKNGEKEISNERDAITIFNEKGVYQVELSITSLTESESIAKEIEVIENPLKPEDIVVKGDQYTSRTTGSAYQWFLDGNLIPGAVLRTFVNSEGLLGTFQVLVTKGACNIMSNSIVTSSPLIPTGETGILVYPNPAGSEIFLDLGLNPDAKEKIEVIIADLLGRSLIHRSYMQGEGLIRMSTESLRPGMYLISIRYGNVIHAERLVIR